MITRRTVLRVEELGARIVPSATAPVVKPPAATAAIVPTAATSPAPVKPIAAAAWEGHGRYTIATLKAGAGKTYTFQGSAAIGKLGYFAISGTITTVGNVRTGHATGRLTISSRSGTLVINLTGPTQTKFAAMPPKFTYTVVSATGKFAHWAGKGDLLMSVANFSGYNDKGHFDMNVRAAKL
jgi:hypothetical protein